VGAALLFVALRVGLSALPFGIFRRVLTRLARPQSTPSVAGRVAPERIAWAVTTASRYAFKPTCLVRAITAQLLLRRAGHPAELYIGVSKEENGRFRAHAWVEGSGSVIIGGSELEEYVALLGRHGRKPNLLPS